MPDKQHTSYRQMSSAVAEAEKLKAAGDVHKRDLAQAKLVEREAELASMRDKLRAANREASSECPATPALPLREGYTAFCKLPELADTRDTTECLLQLCRMLSCRYDEGAERGAQCHDSQSPGS